MAGWHRVEAMTRSVDLEGGLQAKIADPVWMMARQWQVGEFRGDDSAQPAVVRAQWRAVPLTSYRSPATRGPVPIPPRRPLEAVAEASGTPTDGAAGLHAAARAARRLFWLLRERRLPAATDALRAEFPLIAPQRLVEGGASGRATVALLARWGLDTASLAAAPPARTRAALSRALPDGDVAAAEQVLADWRGWYHERITPTAGEAWSDERLEHSFTVGARDAETSLDLVAREHDGGRLDWYTFDMGNPEEAQRLTGGAGPAAPLPIPAPGPGAGSSGPDVKTHTTVVLPSPARYRGMPASRWWEFEDNTVDFGHIEAGPGDVARLLVAEFATSFSDDWFGVPMRVPTGALVEMVAVDVWDTFGGRTPLRSFAAIDEERLGARRPWRLFELTGDRLSEEHDAPWLLIPPSTVGDLEGPPIEETRFARDEDANLVWGIESHVEGPLGRAVDRAEAWHSRVQAREPESPAATDAAWAYRLEAPAPPWWIPFLPQRIDPDDDAQVRLRRSRMQSWAVLDRTQVGPQSSLLDPTRPRWLSEEEVPRDGVVVEVRWRYARWRDGSAHLWRQRRRLPGRPTRSSGLRWDLLDGAPSPDDGEE